MYRQCECQKGEEMSKPERQAAVWDLLEDRVLGAAERWEKEQIDMAMKLSLEQSDELMEKIRRSREKISRKLKKRDLEVVETARDGTCQFLAVLFSAGIEMDVQQFRMQVVQYLRSFPELFKEQMQTNFRNFSDYCDAMARPDGRGDDLTLTCMSHLLLRPIVCVPDHSLEPDREFFPPQTISPEVWGPPVYIAHVCGNHFEATAAIPKETAQTLVSVKAEK